MLIRTKFLLIVANLILATLLAAADPRLDINGNRLDNALLVEIDNFMQCLNDPFTSASASLITRVNIDEI